MSDDGDYPPNGRSDNGTRAAVSKGDKMLTDEQLIAYEVESAESCGLGFDKSQDLINEVRRLRDLERLLRPFVKLDPDSEEPIYLLDGANAWTSEDAEKVQAIGRLLYGQND